ncbi:DNA repair protein rad18 [Tothia fuscella]|uniref:Postreplication repair E3 ubiquitin-protein ligase RAD18 n=1 Tax=Tothia fuscella TaxID=1048955 RepID=A0A9P4TWI1_9PEZI|nr:DNA repair protein rad18 [Tothia fuscella]
MSPKDKNEIADSTDWLPTSLPQFSVLESSLRCQVCKDFYDTPMITSCSHTFCSLCIRRCLSSDGKCPACRASDQTSKLRSNWGLQEVVDAFKAARQGALELARRAKENEGVAHGDGAATNGMRRGKRKLEQADLGPEEEHGRVTRTKQTRTQPKRGTRSTQASQEVITIPDSDIDAEEEYQSEAPEEKEPEDGLVACPMCDARMKEELVFPHLDRCDGKPKPERREARASTPPPAPPQSRQNPAPPISPMKPLPHLNYNLLKEGPLKKKLSELGIPTFGNRQLLIRRHTQWVDIFNANCDSPRPRSTRELLKDLDTWERTQGGYAPGQGQTAPTGVMRKDFDGDEWSGRHKGQFDDLIAAARAKLREKKQAEQKAKEEEATSSTNGISSTPTKEPPPLMSNQDPAIPDIISEVEPHQTHEQPHQPSLSKRNDDPPIPALSILSSAAAAMVHDTHPQHAIPPTHCSEPHSLQINDKTPTSPDGVYNIPEPLS